LERITVDVADSQAVERALGATAARRPAPDLVIHSAGIQLAKPFSDLTADEFRRVIEVNLIGSRNIAAAVLTPALDRLVPRSMSHRIADIVVSSALRDAEHD
jgi:NAD(P)-dependent dehydrogenase (short-subunit alcohol dehydrogenase family)